MFYPNSIGHLGTFKKVATKRKQDKLRASCLTRQQVAYPTIIWSLRHNPNPNPNPNPNSNPNSFFSQIQQEFMCTEWCNSSAYPDFLGRCAHALKIHASPLKPVFH